MRSRDVVMRRDKETNTTAGLPADILIDGSQVLVHRCTTTGVPNSRTFTAATGALVSGPNVMLLHRSVCTQRYQYLADEIVARLYLNMSSSLMLDGQQASL